MTSKPDDDDGQIFDDDVLAAMRIPRNHGKIVVHTNGNSAVNRIVWAAAALFVAVIVTINSYMWSEQIAFTREVVSRLSTLEAQMTILLSRDQ